jgi:hypothetical protein
LIAAKPTLGLNKSTKQVMKSPTKGRFSAASVVILTLMVRAGGLAGAGRIETSRCTIGSVPLMPRKLH